MKDCCDWMLNPLVFRQIQTLMGPLEIDLFSSCLSKQLPRFYSWRPDPEAENTYAFSQDWSKAKSFANPIWCLIVRSLRQKKQQRARVVMITPLWITQLWYPIDDSRNVRELSLPLSSNSCSGNTVTGAIPDKFLRSTMATQRLNNSYC